MSLKWYLNSFNKVNIFTNWKVAGNKELCELEF